MRPIKLTLCALGPFAKSQVFDFTELGDNNIFLITGNTGAGKTTMFDAMCLALFGESSAGQSGRQARDLRSDFAAEEVLTEVTFDFKLGDGALYRAYYAPEQERKKKRGDGRVKITASAWLKSLPIDAEPELLAEGVRTTKDKIEGLMGLDSSQFRQVVMLAQGQFRSLLEADSQNREKIFETLFGTQYYAQIEQRLKDQAADIQRDYRDAKSKLITILEGTGAETVEQLVCEIAEYKKTIETLKAEEDAAEKILHAAQAALDAGKAGNERLREQAESETVFIAQKARDTEFSRKGKTLELAEAAERLTPLYKSQQLRGSEERLVREQLTQQQADLKQSRQQQETTATALKSAAEQKPEIEQKKNRLQLLEGKRPKLAEYSLASKELEHAKTVHLKVQAEHTDTQKALTKVSTSLQKGRVNLERLRTEDQDLEAITQAGQAIKRLIEAHREIARLEQLIHDQNPEIAQITATISAQQEQLQTARQRQKEALAAWIAGQSARIAETLREGHPCPVCGSHEHPQPQEHRGEQVTDEQLAALDAPISQAEERLAKTTDALQQCQNEQARWSAQKEIHLESLKDEQETTLEVLIQRRAELLNRYTTVKQNKQAIETQLSKIAALEEELKNRQQAQENAQQRLQGAVQQETKLSTLVETLARDLDEEYRTQAALSRDIERLKLEIDEFEKIFQQADKKSRAANDRCIELLSLVKSTEAELKRNSAALNDARAEYRAKLADSPFPDEESFLAAILGEDEMRSLKSAIASHTTNLAKAHDRFIRATAHAQGLTPADLPELQENCTQAAQELNASKKSKIQQEEALAVRSKEKKRLDQEQQNIERLDARYQTLGRIAEVANGNNNKRTSFHRFVLQILLDEVLEIASQRLLKMTNQRFYLSRDDHLRDARKQSGLDLILTDSFTGTQRPVKSLSGGEGFLAALALALGLCDVVQAHAGGIKLDTIFIDEGFGSLSPDALDQAIEVLNSLSGEGRLVGIISHVPELRQQIGAQLRIEDSPTGSRASFRV